MHNPPSQQSMASASDDSKLRILTELRQAHDEGTQPSQEILAEALKDPTIMQEHFKNISEAARLERERSESPSTKRRREDSHGKKPDEEEVETDENMMPIPEALEFRMARMTHYMRAIEGVAMQHDQMFSQSLVLFKKNKDTTMKAFYEDAEAFLGHLEQHNLWNEFGIVFASGPKIFMIMKSFTKNKRMLERMMEFLKNKKLDHTLVVSWGSGAGKRMRDGLRIAAYQVIATMAGDAITEIKNRTIKTKWPKNGGPTAQWSLSPNGEHIIAGEDDLEDCITTIAVKKKFKIGAIEMTAQAVMAKLKEKYDRTPSRFMLEYATQERIILPEAGARRL